MISIYRAHLWSLRQNTIYIPDLRSTIIVSTWRKTGKFWEPRSFETHRGTTEFWKSWCFENHSVFFQLDLKIFIKCVTKSTWLKIVVVALWRNIPTDLWYVSLVKRAFLTKIICFFLVKFKIDYNKIFSNSATSCFINQRLYKIGAFLTPWEKPCISGQNRFNS